MTKLTVICTNDDCQTIFPGDVDMVNAHNISFSNCHSGTCPKCSSPGRIPDGTYDAFEDKIYAQLKSINDISFLKKITEAINKDIKRNKSPKNIKKTLNKKFPEQRLLWNLIPKTRQDAYSVINIILATIMTVTAVSTVSNNDKQITNNTTINTTHNHYESTTNNTTITRTETNITTNNTNNTDISINHDAPSTKKEDGG